MKTSARSLALAACLAGAAALAPHTALAAGGRGFGGPGHSGGGWHGGGHAGAGWHGGNHAGAGWRGGRWDGRRGYVRPGVVWGGVGLGLGLGAVGYYGGWWGPYGDVPYAYDGYYYDAVPSVLVSPGVAAPGANPPAPASRSPDPIFYPNKGQNAATTESDRRDCNRWATTQSGAMADASIFQRATFACMEGRGYTVR